MCADAIANLAGQVTGYGGMGCDLTIILYSPSSLSTYDVGVRDQVTSKLAYLQVLVDVGVIVDSAYQTFQASIIPAYSILLDKMHTRIGEYDTRCLTEFQVNTNTNV